MRMPLSARALSPHQASVKGRQICPRTLPGMRRAFFMLCRRQDANPPQRQKYTVKYSSREAISQSNPSTASGLAKPLSAVKASGSSNSLSAVKRLTGRRIIYRESIRTVRPVIYRKL